MEEKRTTPEDVVNAVGALIVDMTDNGYNDGELTATIDAYVRLLEATHTAPAPTTYSVLHV